MLLWWTMSCRGGGRTIASVVDDYTLVGFMPLDPNEEETIENVLLQADMVRWREERRIGRHRKGRRVSRGARGG